ncbi:zinc finger BED domain-containing protein RICESLEEPER 2-like protein [Tanacetum coccineum]
MGVAAVLDPRMKLKIMKFSFPKLYPSKETANGKFNKLKKFLSALFKEYDQASMENARNQVPGVGSTSHIDDSDGGFFSGYSKFIEEDDTSDITSEEDTTELDHYLKERICSPNVKLDILEWLDICERRGIGVELLASSWWEMVDEDCNILVIFCTHYYL